MIDTEHALYIILELASGGELFDKILDKVKFNEKEAKFCFYQMVSAVEYLHRMNIAHRDLKPENILLTNDDSDPLIKISDMGLSKLVDQTTFLQTFCGTPQYLAPEVLISRVRGDGSYGFEVDMWSLGVILYILLSGCPPFNPDRSDGKTLIRQVCDGDYSFPQSRWADISPAAIDMVRKLMTVERKNRLTAKQALQHLWLNDPDNAQRANSLMDMEQKAHEESKNGTSNLSTSQPDCLIQEVTCKKRPAEQQVQSQIESSENDCNAFILGKNTGIEMVVSPPSKKVKV